MQCRRESGVGHLLVGHRCRLARSGGLGFRVSDLRLRRAGLHRLGSVSTLLSTVSGEGVFNL